MTWIIHSSHDQKQNYQLRQKKLRETESVPRRKVAYLAAPWLFSYPLPDGLYLPPCLHPQFL